MEETKIIDLCKTLTTNTFSETVPELKRILLDDAARPLLRLHIADYFFRKIYYYYRARGQERDAFIKAVTDSVARANQLLGKSSYLKYTDVDALREICLHFYRRARFPAVYFILQMINDQTLINLYDVTEMEEHFVAWIQEENLGFEEKSNLLDVLLRNFPKNAKLQAIRDELSGGRAGVISIYENKQNAHDEKLTAQTIEKAYLLFEDTVKYYHEKLNIDEYVPAVLKGWYPGATEVVDTVLTRAGIDHTMFGDSAVRTFTISNLLTSVVLYIVNAADNHKILKQRLLEEFQDMKNLCASGYVLRLMNVFRGIVECYEANIDFEDQLHARLVSLVSTLFTGKTNVPDDVVAGTYDPEYKEIYQKYVLKFLAKKMPELRADYGRADIEGNIRGALNRLFQDELSEEMFSLINV